MTIYDRWDRSQIPHTSPSFDVLAIVTTYNEADVVEQVLSRLVECGIRVHVIDNWSTDGTAETVGGLLAGGSVTLERFPVDGPSPYYEWKRLLNRIEEVAHSSGADWVIHHDADEIREAPWPDTSLRDALWAVEHWGYNCIDHTVINFRPIDDSWRAGADLARSFEWYEFGDAPGHFLQLKAWKPQSTPVTIAASGGHDAEFEGRRVFPYKFMTRHYPIRSPEHGRRKVLVERQGRWSPAERAKGWHAHYDRYGQDSSFLWARTDLWHWSDIDRRFMLQRLSGVSLPGNPWPGESIA